MVKCSTNAFRAVLGGGVNLSTVGSGGKFGVSLGSGSGDSEVPPGKKKN